MTVVLSNRSGAITRRLIAAWNAAPLPAHVYGMNWYAAAHEQAADLAERYGVTVECAAGAIAALSPSCEWSRNLELAEAMLATGDASHPYGDAIRKARRIRNGEAPLEVLGGDKVRSFYSNIVDPEGSIDVTIDRHAFDVCAGRVTDDATRKALELGGRRTPSGKTRNYVTLERAHVSAARILGVRPHQVQAVTWEAWRMAKSVG
jgi:hypothetical protein